MVIEIDTRIVLECIFANTPKVYNTKEILTKILTKTKDRTKHTIDSPTNAMTHDS